jgi:hypothetical protein
VTRHRAATDKFEPGRFLSDATEETTYQVVGDGIASALFSDSSVGRNWLNLDGFGASLNLPGGPPIFGPFFASDIAAAPEPGGLALLGASLLGFGAIRHRRCRRPGRNSVYGSSDTLSAPIAASRGGDDLAVAGAVGEGER